MYHISYEITSLLQQMNFKKLNKTKDIKGNFQFVDNALMVISTKCSSYRVE